MPAEVVSRRSSLVFSLGVLTVLAAFFYESIVSKTEGNETSVVAVGVLLLLPLVTKSSLLLGTLWKSIQLSSPLLLLAIAYIYLQDLSLIPDANGQAIRTAVYTFMMAFALSMGFIISRNLRGLHISALIVVAFMVAGATYWVRDFNQSSVSGFAQTKNVVSGIAMHASFLAAFLWMHRRPESTTRAFVVASLTCLTIAVIASQRVIAPGALASMMTFWIVSRTGIGRVSKLVTFLIFLTALWLIFAFISELNYNPNLVAMNEWTREWTGRRINSGREDLWHLIAYHLQRSPLMGLGTGVLPGSLFQTHLASAHNSFLQVAMQVGFMGLCILLCQIYSVLSGFQNGKNKALLGAAIGYFTFSMVHASFESFLTSNNFIIGSLVWLNFGLLVGLIHTPSWNTPSEPELQIAKSQPLEGPTHERTASTYRADRRQAGHQQAYL